MESRRNTPHELAALTTRRLWTLLLVLGAALAGGGVAVDTTFAAGAHYTITDLGSLGGGYSEGDGINGSGQVAGRSSNGEKIPVHCPRHPCTESVIHAFTYSAGTITDLGTLGGKFSYGQAINSAGDVAGYAPLSTGSYHAFLDHNGHMTDLGTIAASGSSEAFGVNNFGEVAGWSTAANGGQHAFLYSGGKMTDLGTLGSNLSFATGINNLHQVVGSSDLTGGLDTHAFLWSNGTMKDLGTLGGSQSLASAINDAGQVVGNAQTSSSADRAFLYSAGRMTDLGVYNIDTSPKAINSSAVIVGETYGVNKAGYPFSHAFIHTAGGFQDLNNLIPAGSPWELVDATGINNAGQIVANAYNTTTYQHHAVLLNPM